MNYEKELRRKLIEMTNDMLEEERSYCKFQIEQLKTKDNKMRKYLELIEWELSTRAIAMK